LDREVNKNKSVNAQKHLPALTLLHNNDTLDFRGMLLRQLGIEYPGSDAATVLDFDLFLYDTQVPALVGMQREFIASARLDNLLSCYTGLNALIDSDGRLPCLLVCNDHEEVGSQSAIGAQGPFLHSVLKRWCGDSDRTIRSINRSMMVSTDNAHGIHPNFSDKHDEQHGPILNMGPAIKVNANQRYASDSETRAIFRNICDGAAIPLQSFVNRADLSCGSTIGPLTSSAIGIRTLDVGVPQFAMHSIRELCGARDSFYLYVALREFCKERNLMAQYATGSN
jgi:aspartyl aminopeptidase